MLKNAKVLKNVKKKLRKEEYCLVKPLVPLVSIA